MKIHLKLFEYLSNGIPILANDIGSWCEIIKENKIGILTDDEPKKFGNEINSIIEDKNLYLTMQKNIFKLLQKNYSWKNHVQTLLPFYRKLS